MLRCRKMLVPVKFLDGFEDVLKLLETVLWRLERLALPGTRPDAVGGNDQDAQSWSFKPP
jgi:hypothetical protein